MAGFLHFLKTIFIPLLLALILYLLLAYLLIPLYRRHHTRYSQYLPLSTPDFAASSSSSSLRSRLASGLAAIFIPTSWIQNRQSHVEGHDVDDSTLFSDEEGEGMVGFDPIDERRREALEQRRSLGELAQRRLSRELEEGFRDDSDEEGDNDDDPRRRSLSRGRRDF